MEGQIVHLGLSRFCWTWGLTLHRLSLVSWQQGLAPARSLFLRRECEPNRNLEQFPSVPGSRSWSSRATGLEGSLRLARRVDGRVEGRCVSVGVCGGELCAKVRTITLVQNSGVALTRVCCCFAGQGVAWLWPANSHGSVWPAASLNLFSSPRHLTVSALSTWSML